MTTATSTHETSTLSPQASNLRDSIARHLRYTVGVTRNDARRTDVLNALASSIRERLVDGIEETETRYNDAGAKRLYYLSMEFLVGQSLENNLRNLHLYDETVAALADLGYDLSSLFDAEEDAGLGNGGLGRLAACFLDSLATLGMPGFGYGINYEYGLFRQEIKGGSQRERPDAWMTGETPWLIERKAEACLIPLYGRIVHDYFAITEDNWTPQVPRTYIFSGKAAPGYWAARQIIRLISQLGRIINSDPCASQHMRVVFLPNYRVSLAERIFPASDLSEQISTAGYEASGTGNMKFMLNGAITMGTLDGANVEMLKEVGDDNMFIFGADAAEVQHAKHSGRYRPEDYYNANPHIRRVMDSLNSSRFCPSEPGLFEWIFHSLMLDNESYYHLGDFESYLDAQHQAGELFADRTAWAQQAIRNTAAAGKFSSDRTIREYASEIWDIRSFV